MDAQTIELVSDEALPADQNPALVYLAKLSPTGRRTQAQALRACFSVFFSDDALESVRVSRLRYQHTAAIRAAIAEKYSPATCNKMLSALRGVLREAWRLGQMSAEDYQRAADLEPVIGSTVPAGRELEAGEILALFQACQRDPSPAGTRDAAIIGLLYAAGLRRAEIASLTCDSLDVETGKMLIRGKRNKERTVYVTNGALDALKDWLAIRGQGEALFVSVNKGGNIDPDNGLTAQAIYNMLVKRGEEAEVKKFSPHDMRRTFISDLLEKGADLATVSKMAGHANVQTTARYDRRPEEAKQKAAKLLHVPYKKKDSGA